MRGVFLASLSFGNARALLSKFGVFFSPNTTANACAFHIKIDFRVLDLT